jgi:hypothetical protein
MPVVRCVFFLLGHCVDNGFFQFLSRFALVAVSRGVCAINGAYSFSFLDTLTVVCLYSCTPLPSISLVTVSRGVCAISVVRIPFFPLDTLTVVCLYSCTPLPSVSLVAVSWGLCD